MDWIFGLFIFCCGCFVGFALSCILSADGMDSERDYYYNLGMEAARREIENEKTV